MECYLFNVLKMEWFILYIFIGLFVGIFAGMLGIGGGTTLVPLLVFAFQAQQFPPDLILQTAIATSLATIVFTSISSLKAHNKHGAVRWDLVKKFSLGLILGSFIGTLVVDSLNTLFLAIFFVFFVYISALRLFIQEGGGRIIIVPNLFIQNLISFLVGVISCMVGAGGGVITIPLMIFSGIQVKHAVGTSSALGLPIALAGTIGFIFFPSEHANFPKNNIGYINFVALVGVVIGTLSTVPLGAKLAHKMSNELLKKIFATLLFFLATKMAWEIIS